MNRAATRTLVAVVVSGGESSDEDGRVAAYRFEIDGPDGDAIEQSPTSSTDPDATVAFPGTGRYAVSVVVADDMGVESAAPATATVPVRERTTTATATGTPTAAVPRRSNSTTTLRTNAQSSLLPRRAVSATFGGLLGLVLYGAALVLGAYGAVRSFRRAGVPVRGTTINGLAAVGVLVWTGFGLPGTDGLLALGVGAGALWVALVALLWVITRQLYG